MLIAAIVVLALLLAVALARLAALKRELRTMAGAIEGIHGAPSNRQLRVSSGDKDVAALAVAVNHLYDDMAAERAAHTKAVGEMRQAMAGISHDLRTPLTSILGYLNLLKNGGNTPAQQSQYIEVAYKKAGALSTMVDSVFELSRLQANMVQFSTELLDLNELLAEELAGTYEMLRTACGEPALALAATPLWIYGDKQAVARVYSNLLQNMVKHGAREVEITSHLEGEGITLCFANAAPGLTAADAERLFQRFYVADKTRGRQNSGLGLAITKEFVEQMGGSATAALEDGRLRICLHWKAARR